jgi:putative transposase
MKVSASGYYAWRNRLTKPPCLKRRKLADFVRQCYFENRKRYGSRRIQKALATTGVRIGRRKVRSLMSEQKLKAIQPRAFKPQTTDSKGVAPAPNLAAEIKPEECLPGKIIIGDITYIRLRGGRFCYLAVWQDRMTQRIIGWSLSLEMTAELAIFALKKAVNRGWIKAGAIVHSDQGSQYASNAFRQLLQKEGFRQSMSSKGNRYDNAQAESFFSRFKAELIEDGVFEDLEQARSEIFSYIEGYYNRVRLHSSLGYKSPMKLFDSDKLTSYLTETSNWLPSDFRLRILTRKCQLTKKLFSCKHKISTTKADYLPKRVISFLFLMKLVYL